MGWRSLMISNPARLARDCFSLLIEQEHKVRVPFEDIAVIVLDHREITLTHPVLVACGEHGIGLFSTDDSHVPNGVFTPFVPHSRAVRGLRIQMAVKKPLAKQAWAAIVRAKIRNQARCLAMIGKPEGRERLDAYACQVRSGDSTMMESTAAAFYFACLFGDGFRRSRPVWINAALNYGYAIMRGAIARGLVAHGLFPPLGLHHASEQNAFNLADDLIEPFRPLVDLHAALHDPKEERPLSPKDKVSLVSLLNVDMDMPRGRMSVLSAIEQSVESLSRMFQCGSMEALELPRLAGASQHEREC